MVLATTPVTLQHLEDHVGCGSRTMAEDFDPYYKWLGIPPHEQPPNHYRLLGIELFETNLDVITSASDRQIAYLRSFQTGPQMYVCQRLLNEVIAAQLILLDSSHKAAYDETLHALISGPNLTNESETIPLTPADIFLPVDEIVNQEPATDAHFESQPAVVLANTSRLRIERHRRVQPVFTTIAWLVASAVCVYALYLVLQAVVANLAPLAI